MKCPIPDNDTIVKNIKDWTSNKECLFFEVPIDKNINMVPKSFEDTYGYKVYLYDNGIIEARVKIGNISIKRRFFC